MSTVVLISQLIESASEKRRWTRENKTERGRIDSKSLQVHGGGEGKSVRAKEAEV
jgi:hypothetical protein